MGRELDTETPTQASKNHYRFRTNLTLGLHKSIIKNDIPRVLEYLRLGANINREIPSHRLKANRMNRYPYVEFSEDKICALFLAIKLGRLSILKILVDNNADVQKENNVLMKYVDYIERTDKYEEIVVTPLKYAAGLGHTDIVLLLLDSGAQVNQRNSIDANVRSSSPLFRAGKHATDYALSFGHNRTAQLLYSKHPEYINLDRLHYANAKCSQSYKALIENYLHIERTQPSHSAIEIMSKSIANGIFPDSVDKYLLWADILEFLLDKMNQASTIQQNHGAADAAISTHLTQVPKTNDQQFESYKSVFVNAIREFLKQKQLSGYFDIDSKWPPPGGPMNICYHPDLWTTLVFNLSQNDFNQKLFNIENDRIKALGLSLGECAGIGYDSALKIFCDVFGLESNELSQYKGNNHLLAQFKHSLFASSFKIGQVRTQLEGFEAPLLDKIVPGPIVPTATLLRYPQAARRHATNLLDTIKSSISTFSILKKRSADEINGDADNISCSEAASSKDQHLAEFKIKNEPYPGASATAAAAYAAAMAALDENEGDTFGVLNAELTASDTHVDEFETVGVIPALTPLTPTQITSPEGKQEEDDPIPVDNKEDDGRAKPSPAKRRKTN